MNWDNYLLLSADEDGIQAGFYSEKGLMKTLSDMSEYMDLKFIEEFPDDLECWPEHTYMVIKGKAVLPKPSVLKYQIEETDDE